MKRRTRPARARPKATRSASVSAAAVPPASGLSGALDDIKATTIALLASLQDKERVLRERAESDPSPGVTRGLADIDALRRWADRTLRTIEVLERGRDGELGVLLQELGEFGDILRERQPAIPPAPMSS